MSFVSQTIRSSAKTRVPGRFAASCFHTCVPRTNKQDLALTRRLSPRRYSVATEGLSSPQSKDWFVAAQKTEDLPPMQGSKRSALRLEHPAHEISLLLPLTWLRDACPCKICLDPHSGNKNFGTTDIPSHQELVQAAKIEDGDLKLTWKADFMTEGKADHVSTFSADDVAQWFNRTRPKPWYHILWNKRMLGTDLCKVDFKEWMSGGETFRLGLAVLRALGLIVVKNVPKSDNSVVDIATQIGPLQETIYGRTWRVESKPQAENIAYTSSFLGLHQDLLYLQQPPRIQLLHCMENSCAGGESLFSDLVRAGKQVEMDYPQAFKALSTYPVTYEYKKKTHHFHRELKVISITTGLAAWSPPFQKPQQLFVVNDRPDPAKYEDWADAARLFRTILEDDRYTFEMRLEPGDCVVFDNWRVAHGRRQFDATSGSRLLHGTYIAEHDVRARWSMLEPQDWEILDEQTNSYETQLESLMSRE